MSLSGGLREDRARTREFDAPLLMPLALLKLSRLSESMMADASANCDTVLPAAAERAGLAAGAEGEAARQRY